MFPPIDYFRDILVLREESGRNNAKGEHLNAFEWSALRTPSPIILANPLMAANWRPSTFAKWSTSRATRKREYSVFPARLALNVDNALMC
jgi:hypothetical protein